MVRAALLLSIWCWGHLNTSFVRIQTKSWETEQMKYNPIWVTHPWLWRFIWHQNTCLYYYQIGFNNYHVVLCLNDCEVKSRISLFSLQCTMDELSCICLVSTVHCQMTLHCGKKSVHVLSGSTFLPHFLGRTSAFGSIIEMNKRTFF